MPVNVSLGTSVETRGGFASSLLNKRRVLNDHLMICAQAWNLQGNRIATHGPGDGDQAALQDYGGAIEPIGARFAVGIDPIPIGRKFHKEVRVGLTRVLPVEGGLAAALKRTHGDQQHDIDDSHTGFPLVVL